MRLRIRPENTRFFELFAAAAANVEQAGRLLVETLEAFPDARDAQRRLRACEGEGDRITHELVRLVNSTFVTPLDREDIFALATVIDDVVDHLDEAADELLLYGVRTVPAAAKAQAEVARDACALLARALERLEGFEDVHDLIVAIHTKENEGDALEREALGRLFSGDEDPLVVIRWKDIHAQIEEAVDGCERAATVLESIYLKHR